MLSFSVFVSSSGFLRSSVSGYRQLRLRNSYQPAISLNIFSKMKMHFSTRDPSHKLKKASYKDYSSSKLEDVCSQKQLDSPETNEVTDTKHRAVMQQFVNIVKDANIELKESQKEKIEEIEAINEELVAALEQFFANNRPDITPELLEKRQKLREQYPKMFGNITDEELDKN